MTTIGFIGLGNLGGPMAERLAAAGESRVVVHDLRADACEAAVSLGAEVAADPAALAAGCDVIEVMVRDDDQVLDVLTGTHGVLASARPGTVVAIHSTISPHTAVDMGRAAVAHAVSVVDAPVSGGAMAVAHGDLAAMVGGDAEAVERCRQAFDPWCGLFVATGPLGSATRLKLARNLVTFVSYAAVGEAERLAEAAGIRLDDLARVVRHSDRLTGGASAIMLRDTSEPLADDDPWRPILEPVRGLGEKDLDLAVAAAAELGVDLPLAQLARTQLGRALGVPHDDGEAART